MHEKKRSGVNGETVLVCRLIWAFGVHVSTSPLFVCHCLPDEELIAAYRFISK